MTTELDRSDVLGRHEIDAARGETHRLEEDPPGDQVKERAPSGM
jgi:hypothetical protein